MKSVAWGLDGWERWQRNLGPSISKSLFSLCILWVIIESCYCKPFDISSLAWVQILMDGFQILKEIIICLGLLLAVTAGAVKNCTCRENITYSEMEKYFWKRWKALWNYLLLCNNWGSLCPINKVFDAT